MNEKGIIFRLIFQMGCPVFVIANAIDASEAEIYRYLNGKKMPRETEVQLKRLSQGLIEMEVEIRKIK